MLAVFRWLSSGQDFIGLHMGALKPNIEYYIPGKSIDRARQSNRSITKASGHDPCVGIRASTDLLRRMLGIHHYGIHLLKTQSTKMLIVVCSYADY